MKVTPIALPGASAVVALDYFAYDHSTGKLWVRPATGNVDVIDERSDAVSQVRDLRRGKSSCVDANHVRATAVSVGDGEVISEIAAIRLLRDRRSDRSSVENVSRLLLRRRSGGSAGRRCLCAATKELWITTGAPPIGVASADKAIQIF